MTDSLPAEPTRVCPRCGRRDRAEARFCPEDGAELVERDPLLGQLLLGQIELREVCGHGSMGTVYCAWQPTMERRVAVKVLKRKLLRDAQVVKRFQREARAAASLSHPNIITVYLVGETSDGLPFIVMEFVAGQSLEDVIEEGVPLPPARAIHIARQIASALSEAHAQAVVHRDLKPANILLTSKRGAPDFVKVLDFGIAKILRDGEESRLTKTGAIFGTPYYLSPEQAAGDEVDHRCDLYSLGVLMFRMLTGRLPFDSASAVEVLVQHIKDEPPRPRDLIPSIPAALEALVLRCLAKEPTDRWQSADELGATLVEIAHRLYGGGGTLIGVADSDRSDPSQPELRRTRPTGKMSPVGPITVAGSAPGTARDIDAPRCGTDPAPAAAGTDPRFRVPADGELLDPRPRDPEAGRDGRDSRRAAASIGLASTDLMQQRVVRRRRIIGHLLLSLVSIAVGASAGGLLHYREARPARPAAGPPAPDRGPAPASSRSVSATKALSETRRVDDAAASSGRATPDAGAALPAGDARPARVEDAGRSRARRPRTRAQRRPLQPTAIPAPRTGPVPHAVPPVRPAPHAVRPVGPDPDVGPDPSVGGSDDHDHDGRDHDSRDHDSRDHDSRDHDSRDHDSRDHDDEIYDLVE